MHERGRLQVPPALPSKVTDRPPAKIAIHDQNQAIARSQITRSPGMEQRRHVAGVVGINLWESGSSRLR